MSDLLSAIRFLTIFPAPLLASHQQGELARGMRFFPLIGAAIAVASLSLYWLLDLVFPTRIAAFALIAGPLILSGGLHMDGFADFCDGCFAGKDKRDVLRIMKDTQVGAWGVSGVALLILAKYELLAALPYRWGVFLLALTLSRWAQVVLSYWVPAAGKTAGLGASVAQKVRRRDFVMAGLFVLPVFALLPAQAVMAALAVILFLVLFGRYVLYRVGGITGDVLGAASELTELVVFLTAVALGPVAA